MAKALTKTEIVAEMADRMSLPKTTVNLFFEEQAALAYKQAKNAFSIPGLGKLVLLDRKARVGRNPATGATIQIPAKKVVKFRISKIAKDAILA